jgi:pyrrolysine biosynthesis protein PylC
MTGGGPLHLEKDFFGADEALTNYSPGKADWVATLMMRGSDLEDALDSRRRIIRNIRDRSGVDSYSDEGPAEGRGGSVLFPGGTRDLPWVPPREPMRKAP